MREALRSLRRPQALVRNPLLASGMAQSAPREHPDSRPDQVLQGLVLEAAEVLKSGPRADSHYRVVDRTYLRPAPTQERPSECPTARSLPAQSMAIPVPLRCPAIEGGHL